MIRRLTIGLAVFILIVLVAGIFLRNYTKSFSPQDTASFSDGNMKLEVEYSRPSKKDRLIFGDQEDGALVPYGEKWRTGANEATEVEFSQDVRINGKELAAGRYSLYTIPADDNWVVAINENTDYWGINLFGETFDESMDVVRGSAIVSKLDEPQEDFLISFEKEGSGKVLMHFSWDRTRASLPIQYE